MKYDLTTLKVVLENEIFAVYIISQINQTKYKGVRLDKRTNKQAEVIIEKYPKNSSDFSYRVVDFIQNGRQK